jgi:Cysteine-rich secretory protein family
VAPTWLWKKGAPETGALRRQTWLSAGALLSLAVAVLVVVAGLTLTSNRPGTGPQPSAAARNNRCWRSKPAEVGFNRKMNNVRGAGRLKLDPELSRVARKHTGEMIRRNILYHTSTGQLSRRVVRWVLLGENVGVGGSVGSLHRAFMHSPPHRANILRSSFNHSGVGVRKAGGRMWVTIIFQANTNPGTRLSMPRC